jgi:hypothetical protein
VQHAPAKQKGEVKMKIAPKILVASLFAAAPFCFAGSVHAVPLGMGLGLTDAVTPIAETVRAGGGRGGARVGGGGARVGAGGGRIGGVGRPGGIGGVGGVGRPGGIGGVGGVGRPGGIGGVAGIGRPGYGWNGGYWRPGYGVAAGAITGAALGGYYGGYGYDGGYYNTGYDTGYYGSSPGYNSDATAYCSQRYKSYDPSSGTYLGYDGARHPCP